MHSVLQDTFFCHMLIWPMQPELPFTAPRAAARSLGVSSSQEEQHSFTSRAMQASVQVQNLTHQLESCAPGRCLRKRLKERSQGKRWQLQSLHTFIVCLQQEHTARAAGEECSRACRLVGLLLSAKE